jgi:hypothetical protein
LQDFLNPPFVLTIAMFRFFRLSFGLLARFLRSRRSLLLEKSRLRQQLAALKRKHPNVNCEPSINSSGSPATHTNVDFQTHWSKMPVSAFFPPDTLAGY